MWLTMCILSYYTGKDVSRSPLRHVMLRRYIVYGPLANGASVVLFEGIPTYPNNSRYWDLIQKYKINQFYTAPTAIR